VRVQTHDNSSRPITTEDILDVITPIASVACKSQDQAVLRAGIILIALAGILVDPVDTVALDSLSTVAGKICEHQLGLHNHND